MKKSCVILLMTMMILMGTTMYGFKHPGETKTGLLSIAETMKQQNNYGQLPLHFIPNQGQVDDGARFYARTPGYTLWLTQKGMVFDSVRKGHSENTGVRDVSRLLFVGANGNAEMKATEQTGHRVNYIRKNGTANLNNIKTSRGVLYKNLYNKVDLKIYGIEKKIEYDWIVHSGGNPEDIRFQYQNVLGTRIDDGGNLIVQTQLGELIHKRPVSFQIFDEGKTTARKVPVNVEYVKIGAHTYGLNADEYDESKTLIIDPIVMTYGTYLGGSGNDRGISIAVDSSGCAYVTGDTYGTDFPTHLALQSNHGGGDRDVWVAKFAADGENLIYSTYIGGTGTDSGEGIAVDGNGKAHVVGLTSSTDFPTASPYQATYGGGDRDAFLAILSADGGNLDFSSFLGGSHIDQGFAIALDGSDNIYITGRTYSSDFPTANPVQNSIDGNVDAFAARFAAGGASLTYSTFLGGGGSDTGYGIAVYGNNALITGTTSSSDFPTQNAYDDSYGNGGSDAFLTKLSSTGDSLVFSGYLGGSGADSGYGVAVDGTGCAYVAGETESSDFPTTTGSFQQTTGGKKDSFVTKFALSGTSLDYSTFLGGGENDGAAHVAVNAEGYAFATGYTASTDFPIRNAAQATFSGGADGFVTMLTPAGSYLNFSTFLGGGGDDYGKGIAWDESNAVYVCGHSDSTDLTLTDSYQSDNGGGSDAVVAKYDTTGLGSNCGSLDNCDILFTMTGDAEWFDQAVTTYYDGDALQSGAIDHNEISTVEAVVSGEGELSFWYKVSSESCCDFFRFEVNGVQKIYRGGQSGWQNYTLQLPAGNHTLQWSYTKDGSVDTGSDCAWLDKVEFIQEEAEISLSRSSLTFGATKTAVPPSQDLMIENTGGATLNWSVSADADWLAFSATSGTNAAVIDISLDETELAGMSAGTYTGTISVSDQDAANSPQTVDVTLTLYAPGSTAIPFGYYSTPATGSTIRSNVPFTGWVLDDIGVVSVKIYREYNGTQVYIGDAVMVEGARPDVENDFPTYPMNYKAGWGYMMLTNYLPNGGNGTFTITAIATDVEGNSATLGSKTVTVDNANAVKPFGTIDTPGQGGTASGTGFVNWGWALTPMPNMIPTDGSTINVWIDGAVVGHPTYNVYRKDLAELFPGYNNTDGAVGYFYIDTTAYSNGVHNIAWSVTDNAGNTDGIGSRYFTVSNTSSRTGGASVNGAAGSKGSPMIISPEQIRNIDADSVSPAMLLKGFRRNAETTETDRIYPNKRGALKVNIHELERFELRFEGVTKLSGWMVTRRGLRTLPVGSTLKTDSGSFSWQAGIGFIGDYQLVFLCQDANGIRTLRRVAVHIDSKSHL